MTHLLHRNDKFVGVHNKCSKIQPSNLKHFASRVRKIACCSFEPIFTFHYAGSSIQNANEQFVSCIQIYIVNSPLRQIPQTKKNLTNRFKQPYLGHLSVLDIYSYEFSSRNVRYCHSPKHWRFLLIFMDPCIVDYSLEIPTRCSFVREFIIPKLIEGSTCFERHTAHH